MVGPLHLGVDTCNAPVAVEAAETASMVVVKVTARDDTSQDCRDGIEVVLVRPLGDRALIDGSTGRPVRVGASSE